MYRLVLIIANFYGIIFCHSQSLWNNPIEETRRNHSTSAIIDLGMGAFAYPEADIIRTSGPYLPLTVLWQPVHGYRVGYEILFDDKRSLALKLGFISMPFSFKYAPGTIADTSGVIVVESNQQIRMSMSLLNRLSFNIRYCENIAKFLEGDIKLGIGVTMDIILAPKFSIGLYESGKGTSTEIFDMRVLANDKPIYGVTASVSYSRKIIKKHGVSFDLGAMITGQQLYTGLYTMAPGTQQRNHGTIDQAASYLSLTIAYNYFIR